MLHFTDDTICEESVSNIFTIKTMLRVFDLASGLKVNFHKSKFEEEWSFLEGGLWKGI